MPNRDKLARAVLELEYAVRSLSGELCSELAITRGHEEGCNCHYCGDTRGVSFRIGQVARAMLPVLLESPGAGDELVLELGRITGRTPLGRAS